MVPLLSGSLLQRPCRLLHTYTERGRGLICPSLAFPAPRYPFESTFDPDHLAAKGIRTIDLPTFRLLSDGRVELCYAESKVSHDQQVMVPPPSDRPSR